VNIEKLKQELERLEIEEFLIEVQIRGLREKIRLEEDDLPF